MTDDETKARKRGQRSRRKGATGERDVRDLFRQAGFLARRSIGQYRTGSDAPDVLVEGIPELWIEVKRGQRCNIKAALAQAQRDCGRNDWPIAVTREDRAAPIVSMSFNNFAALLKRAYPEALAPVDGGYDANRDQDVDEEG